MKDEAFPPKNKEDPALLGVEARAVQAFLDKISDRYGSIERFLESTFKRDGLFAYEYHERLIRNAQEYIQTKTKEVQQCRQD